MPNRGYKSCPNCRKALLLLILSALLCTTQYPAFIGARGINRIQMWIWLATFAVWLAGFFLFDSARTREQRISLKE